MDQNLPDRLELVLAGMFAAGLVSLAAFAVRAFRAPDRWLECASVLCWRPFTVRHAAGIVALLMALQFGLVMVLGLGGVKLETSSTALLVISTILMHWAGLAAALWLLRQNGWSMRVAFGGSRLSAPLQIATGVLGYLALMPVIALVSYLTISFITVWNQAGLPLIQNEEQMILEFFKGGQTFRLAYATFTAVILAPVAEEVLFRGIALPALARRMGSFKAVMAVSFLFAAIHFHVAGFPVLFTLGVALAVAYLRTSSLLVPIALHTTFNLATVLIVNLRGSP